MRKTNRNPRVFRYASNGVKGIGKLITYGVGGIVKGTGKVVNVGTGIADKAIGTTGRLFTGKNKRKHSRNTKKRQTRKN